jgi:hypothetical protein
VTRDLLTHPALEERVHFFVALLALSTAMTGALYWLMALVMEFAALVNDVQMEADPAEVAFIGSVLFAVGAPVALVLGGWWVEVRRIGSHDCDADARDSGGSS